MPLTFAHPLAIIALRRHCPAKFDFAALVIGSMSPDFAYYVVQFPVAQIAHTIPGLFFVCVPTGLLALALFYALRRPLCFMLPQPHRGALMRLAVRPLPRLSAKEFAIASMSILVGAWTHIAWDSFTHASGWPVQHILLLRQPLITVGASTLPVYYFLQQISTVVASICLVWMYFLWLRRHPSDDIEPNDTSTDRRRYILLVIISAFSLGIAMPIALLDAANFSGYFAVRVFLFRVVVYATAIFVPMFVICAVIHCKHSNAR